MTASPKAAATPVRVRRAPKLLRYLFVIVLAAVLAVALDFAVLHMGTRSSAISSARLAVFPTPAAVKELLVMAEEQPRDPEWRLRLGQELVRQQHYSSATEAFKDALAMRAPEAPVRAGLAACKEGLDEDEDALKEWERLRQLQPDLLAIPLRIAAIHGRLGRVRDVTATLAAIPLDAVGRPTLRDPGGPLAGLERLGVAYGLNGDWDRSLAAGRLLLREDPRSIGGNAIAGGALLATNHPGEASRHFRAAVNAEPERLELVFSLAKSLWEQHKPEYDAEILRLLEPLVQAGTPPAEALYILAQIHERHRRWAWAGAYFAAAVKMGYQSAAAQHRAYEAYQRAGNREHALYLRGRELEAQRQFPEAIRVYRSFIKLRPTSDAGYRHLARVMLSSGDAVGAIATLEHASTLKSPNPRVFLRLALAYQSVGDLKKKERAWAEFRRRRPEEEYLIEANEANAADNIGKLDEAEAHLRRCIELQPKGIHYKTRLGQLLIERRTDKARLDEAVRLLEGSVQAAPEDADAYVALGTAYRHSGFKREAIWALRHAIDLEPGSGPPYQLLGETLIEAGEREKGKEVLALFKQFRQYTQALDVLTLRLKRNPRDIDVGRRLGALQERSGALREAGITYSRVLAVDPKAAWARDRLNALQIKLGESDLDSDDRGLQRRSLDAHE